MILVRFVCVRCGKTASTAPSEEGLKYSDRHFKEEELKSVPVRCPHCGTWNSVKVPKG
jgi:DNA-directed RNA polymerase subunit RPC12/RpoP